MKPRFLKLLLAFLVIMAIVGGLAFALWPQSDAITDLKDVSRFIEPDGYYSSTRVAKWYMNRETAKGKVLVPRLENVGDFKRQKEEFERHGGFLGPEACRECHAETVDSFTETAHFQTSRFPDPDSLMGEHSDGKNFLETTFPGLKYLMTLEDDGEYYQQVCLDRDGMTYRHKKHVDIVTGSGNHGLTYLYWQDSRLFQLPITWSTIGGGEWVNSPGYSDGFADFARPILAQCMSCHSTRFEVRKGTANEFDQNSFILGVTCERCHGPGQEHVEYHRQNPKETESKFIVHPGHLSRERMNDVCGQCHNGISKPLKPSFSYRPGDRLSDFNKFPDTKEIGTGVHSSNQQARMVKSQCYLQDDSLDCRSCHNPHRNEHGNTKLFSKRCLKCHQVDHCGQFESVGERIATNCIDCHMPKEQDNQMGMAMGTEQIFPVIRDHHIRVHNEATKAVLARWAKESVDDDEPKSTESE